MLIHIFHLPSTIFIIRDEVKQRRKAPPIHQKQSKKRHKSCIPPAKQGIYDNYIMKSPYIFLFLPVRNSFPPWAFITV